MCIFDAKIYYGCVQNRDGSSIERQKNMIDAYITKLNIAMRKIYTISENASAYKTNKEIKKVIDDIPHNSTLLLAEISILGNSSYQILKKLQKAYEKNIAIILVQESSTIECTNASFLPFLDILIGIEEEAKNRKIEAAKTTRKKNNTKLGRKSGKKTKSMFDKHKRTIKRLYKKGVSNAKILERLKNIDENLKNTTPQALHQYIKKIKRAEKKSKSGMRSRLLNK